jgi:putative ABC transport system permease protein
MSRALGKIARRGILRSPGRFIALFFIVLLGAGFLAGLQSSAPAMVGTADDYLARKNLADFRLVCVLGITEADVEALRDVPDVAQVSAGYRVDLKGTIGNTAAFYAMHSLPEDVEDENHLSQLTLTEGRLPETPRECVADSLSSIKVGDVIQVTDDNPSSSLEMLEPRRLTVVGLARSPLYISTTRGNSNIGNGQISYFLYLPREAFSSEYFTEVSLRLASTEGLSAFSREYDEAVDAAEIELEAFTRERAELRHREIAEEASTEIDSAEEEFETEKERVESELASAKEALEDGRTSLDDGYKKYEDARASLANARIKLEENRVTLRSSLRDLNTFRNTWESGRLELAESKASLQEVQRQCDLLKAVQAAESDPIVIATLQAQIEALEAQIAPFAAQVAAAEAELAVGAQQLAAAQDAYAKGEREFDEAEKKVIDGEKALWDSYRELERSRTQLDEGWEEYEQQSEEASTELGKARAELDDTRAELEGFEPPQWIIQSRDDFPGYAGFEADKDRIARLALVLPWFFFIVATIVCLTTMTRLVEEHRILIGTLKACGYGRGQVAAIYQSYALIIGLAGGALGVVCGVLIFPPVIWVAYSTMYFMGEFKSVIAPVPCLIGLFGGAIALFLATAFVCKNALDKNAAELMRPRAPKSGRRVLLERAKRLWRSLPFRIKATIRNLLRYRARFIVTVIGVAGCTALLLAALGLRDSISNMVDLQYGGVSHLRATLILDEPSDSLQDTELNRVLTDYPHAYLQAKLVEASFGGRVSGDIITYLAVPEDPATFPEFITFRERVSHASIGFSSGAAGGPSAVITEQLATAIGAKTGDIVSFGAPSEAPVRVRIAGVAENYVYNYIFITPATYRYLFNEEPRYASIYLRSELEEPEFEDLLSELVATENVATALPVAQVQEVMDQVVENMNSVVSLLIFSAFVLAIVVLYNLITITILERERELALMKVLGYHPREVAASISRETTIMTVIGIAIGIAFGFWLHGYVMKTIEVSEIMFPRIILPLSLVLATLFPLLCNFLVNLVVRPRLNRIDMIESLKSIE